MACLKHILLRLLFFGISLQILNLSIDVDGIFIQNNSAAQVQFDDVDSFSELLVEFLMDDEDLISEEDNDDGNSDQSHSLKYNPLPLFSEGTYIPNLSPFFPGSTFKNFIRYTSWISAGYMRIIVPPPDFS